MKVSFIGLGVMGNGMALNLAKGEKEGEFDFLACDINSKVLKKFQDNGIKTSTNINDTVESDYILLCLPNVEVLKETILGPEGILKDMKAGQTIIDFSTISYSETIKIHEQCEQKDVNFLDCPISGQQKGSEDGTLSIMCGGDEEVFNHIKPILERMGTQILYMGDCGSGQLTKMINNCVLNICAASFSELMPVGVKLGLDPEKLGDVLMTATGSSFASKTLVPKVLEGNFEHGFSLDKAYKDMDSMFEVLTKQEIPLPTLNGAMQSYQLALQHGQRDYYKHAMIRFYEDMLDVKVRKNGFS